MPRSVSISTPSTRAPIRLDRARDPGRHVARPARRSARARPPERRSGGPPRSAAPAPAPGCRRFASRARGWGASTARTRRARRSSPPAPNGPNGRGCRRAGARARRAGRPGPSRARAAPSIPAGASRCPPARSPSPAAIAQALQCGTPGHGQRQPQPPQTGEHALAAPELAARGVLARSRPAVIVRPDLTAARYCRRVDCGAVTSTSATVARRYFDALGAHDLDAALACWRPGAVDRLVGQQELVAPDGIAQVLLRAVRGVPGFHAGGDRRGHRNDGGSLAGDRDVRRPGTFQGFEPNGASLEVAAMS